jgi:immune inhibitor A
VDLTQFAGQKVTLRFEYVTDAAVNGEGFLLDDIAIPEIGYFSDFEADEGGWAAAGFVRIQNILPQTYRLGLILRGDQTTVQYIDLHPSNLAEIPISFDRMVREVTLVVSGTTRHTRQQAPYTINLLPVASP